jgi:hypothetical protein
MASELRVNTLKDASGNNSIAMTYVAEGSAKAWQSITASGGTPSFNDSFNTSSIVDSDVGRHTLNFSNSFSSVNYAVTGCCQTSGTGQLNDSGEFRIGALTTGTEAFSTANEGQTVFVDCPRTHIHQLGDLA